MADNEAQDAQSPNPTTTKPRASTKPRAGIRRKTQAEREEYAKKEAERAKEREAKDAAPALKPAVRGGRGGARGGRGGATTNRPERTSTTVTGGVFGAGSGARQERARAPADLGSAEALDGEASTRQILDSALPGAEVVDIDPSGTGRSGTGGGGGGGGTGTKGRGGKGQTTEQFMQIEDDDGEDQPRRDIERIWISSDEEEEEISSTKGKQRRVSRTPKPFAGLRPVRAARTMAEDFDESSDRKLPKISKSMEDNPVIDVESDEMQVDEPLGAVKKDVPSSPELSKRILKKVDSRTKDPRLLTETIEEKAERIRLYEDTEKMRDSFLHKSDTDDTVDSKEEEAVFGRTDHDRMFLFQLPPLVPHLFDPTTRQVHNGDAMEVEHVQVKAEDDMTGASAPDAAKKKDDQAATQPQIYTADSVDDQRLPAGFVGKLRIHKSGKVTMDWGGTNMEVRYGTEVDFLQDVVCVENPEIADGDEDQTRRKEGQAFALGHIKKKMVLVPDWSKLYA